MPSLVLPGLAGYAASLALIVLACLGSPQLAAAQLLYSEDFDSLPLGYYGFFPPPLPAENSSEAAEEF